MSLVGRWKIVEAIRFNEEFKPEWAPIEELLADEELELGDKIIYSSFMDFTEDGRALNLSPIPEDLSKEEIAELLESGEMEMLDGYLKLTEYNWKTENGKNYLDTRIKGEFLGEEVSSWIEIPVIDGKIEIVSIRIAKDE